MTRLPENNSIISHYFPKDLGKLKGVCGQGGVLLNMPLNLTLCT